MKALRPILQFLVPVLLLLGGAALAHQIASRAKEPVVAPPSARGPLVRTAEVERIDVRIDVDTQGAVEPCRTVELSAQVAGRITAVSPSLRAGGSVAADDVLVTLDPADFDLAIVQQEAAIARAELRLLQERAEADAAVRAWKQLEGERPADPLVTRGPQIADADRSLAAARAALDRARLDRQRTEVKAPFAGRVRTAHADVGQMAQPGQTLGVLFDTAAVEVRLPLPATEVAFVELPLLGEARDPDGRTQVSLVAEFGGERVEWTGHVVRTEGEVDRRTRQVTAIARVEGPYAATSGRPPLLVGTFVQAKVHGRTFRGVLAVPRAALRNGNEVWVVDAERRLRKRKVQVLRTETERALLRDGLAAGELVCVTDLEAPADGMLVRRVGDETAPLPTNGASPTDGREPR